MLQKWIVPCESTAILLIDHTTGFCPQTQKLQQPNMYKTLSFILVVNRLRSSFFETLLVEATVQWAALLQNKLNFSDVAHFTTHIRTCLPTNKVARFIFMGNKMHNIAIQLILQQSRKASYTFCVARFTVP